MATAEAISLRNEQDGAQADRTWTSELISRGTGI